MLRWNKQKSGGLWLERRAKRDGATRVSLSACLKGYSSLIQHMAHMPCMTQENSQFIFN
jgi:hypothetical protein